MFAPNIKRDPLDSYISYYCQDALAAIAAKVVVELTPSYTKGSLSVYTLPHAQGEESIDLVVDSERNKRKPFDQDYLSAPQSVQSYLGAKMYGFDIGYFMASSSSTLKDLVDAVAKWDPAMTENLETGARAAFSTDGFLNECLDSIIAQTASLEAWVDSANQVLSYNGEEAVTTSYNLRPFIASYLKVFKMDGHLILEHNGSAKTMVRKLVPGGAEWYSVDTSYGYAMEKETGILVSSDWDVDLEKNLMPYLTLKHIFKEENCIVKVVNGESFPVSKDVDHLNFCITAICEDLGAKNELVTNTGISL